MNQKKFTLRTSGQTAIAVERFGSGKKKILLISGIHGDEKSGPLILDRFIDFLDSQRVEGVVDIIKIANPEAYHLNQRYHPFDHKDLNRNFCNVLDTTPTDQLARVLGAFALEHDFVIDIHAFPNQLSPVIGVSLSDGNFETRQESQRLLALLQPDALWHLNTSMTDVKKGGSICSLSLQNDIPSFGLELPPDDLIDSSQMNKTLVGIKTVLSSLSFIPFERHGNPAARIPAYEREVYKSPLSGFFIPIKTTLLSRISPHETIGRIMHQNTEEKVDIHSPCRGVLLTVSKERIMQKGEKMFAIGKNVHYFLNKI